jgi:hypothetical protein
LGGKLKGLIERIPLPGGLKRTLLQWIELFEKSARSGKVVRYGSQEFARKLPRLSKEAQEAGLTNIIKAAKQSGLFSGYRTTKGLLSWKTVFGGMPQLIGRNKSVRALVRQTKFWAGFLDFMGLGNFVGPDESLEKMGEAELESKLTEYQKTPEAEQYFKDSFGEGEQEQTSEPSQQTPTSTTTTSKSNPIGDLFKNLLGGEVLGAVAKL